MSWSLTGERKFAPRNRLTRLSAAAVAEMKGAELVGQVIAIEPITDED